MKLRGLKLYGIGRFSTEASLPVEGLGDAELVGVVGENGEGKTTLLECFPGAIYRMMPSRGAVAGLTSDKAWLEVQVETDQAYTARLQINGAAKAKPTEAYLFDAAGKPLNDGKAKTFDAEVARRFPSQSVLLSSAFAAQGGAGRFLELPASARKELFAEMLGLGRLQLLSDAAGVHVRDVEMAIAKLDARAQTLATQAERREALAADVRTAESSHAAATAVREQAERDAAVARAQLEAWHVEAVKLEHYRVQAAAALTEARRQRDVVTDAIERLKREASRVSASRAGLSARLGRRDELEAQLTSARGAAERISELEAKNAETRAAAEQHREELSRWERLHAECEQQLREATTAQRHAEEQAAAGVRAAEREMETLEQAAGGLGNVPCHGDGDFAACPLIAGARRAVDALDAARDRLTAARDHLGGIGSGLTAVDEARDRLADVEAQRPQAFVPVDLSAIDIELRDLRGRQAVAAEARARLEALDETGRQAKVLDEDGARIRTELEQRRTELESMDLGSAEVDARSATDAVGKHAITRPAAHDETALDGLRRAETRSAAELAKTQADLDAATRAVGQLNEVREERDAAIAGLDDWRHLQQALGRNGVQALEIDAAGPEVSDLTNELLHSCYGSRFSVALETAALKADGKGTKEVFDLRVLDTERGTDGSVDQLSGGEKVLVGEALSLAIAIYNTRRSSIPMLDLFRDECAGALSASNSVRYIEMLRRAIRLGGFHRCYFVAHQPQLWDLADARILVADGQARLADAAEITVAARAAVEEAA